MTDEEARAYIMRLFGEILGPQPPDVDIPKEWQEMLTEHMVRAILHDDSTRTLGS